MWCHKNKAVWLLVAAAAVAVVVVFVATFRFGEHLVLLLAVPFLKQAAHFSFAAIATFYQLLGYAGTVAGGVLGGALAPRLAGLERSGRLVVLR